MSGGYDKPTGRSELGWTEPIRLERSEYGSNGANTGQYGRGQFLSLSLSLSSSPRFSPLYLSPLLSLSLSLSLSFPSFSLPPLFLLAPLFLSPLSPLFFSLSLFPPGSPPNFSLSLSFSLLLCSPRCFSCEIFEVIKIEYLDFGCLTGRVYGTFHSQQCLWTISKCHRRKFQGAVYDSIYYDSGIQKK